MFFFLPLFSRSFFPLLPFSQSRLSSGGHELTGVIHDASAGKSEVMGMTSLPPTVHLPSHLSTPVKQAFSPFLPCITPPKPAFSPLSPSSPQRHLPRRATKRSRGKLDRRRQQLIFFQRSNTPLHAILSQKHHWSLDTEMVSEIGLEQFIRHQLLLLLQEPCAE